MFPVEERDGMRDDPEVGAAPAQIFRLAFLCRKNLSYCAAGRWRIERLEYRSNSLIEVLFAAFGIVRTSSAPRQLSELGFLFVVLWNLTAVRGFPLLEEMEQDEYVRDVAVFVVVEFVKVVSLVVREFEVPAKDSAGVGRWSK